MISSNYELLQYSMNSLLSLEQCVNKLYVRFNYGEDAKL